MNLDGTAERRRHRRAAIRIRSEFGDPKSPTRIETVDMSAGGFSCWMNHPVRPLTKLALQFEFPPFGAEPGRNLACEAIVVRCEKRRETDGPWSLAAAFTGISGADRSYIERFVQWHETVMDARREIAGYAGEVPPGRLS